MQSEKNLEETLFSNPEEAEEDTGGVLEDENPEETTETSEDSEDADGPQDEEDEDGMFDDENEED